MHILRTIAIPCLCLVTLSGASQMMSTAYAQQSGREYSGVVMFDRWDSCYLISGNHVIYISKYAKDALRPYKGKTIQVNADDFYEQPISNSAIVPGNGVHDTLIRAYKIIGPMPDTRPYVLAGLQLIAEPDFEGIGPHFFVEIRNVGTRTNTLMSEYIGPLLLGPSPKSLCRPPSEELDEDVSTAIITRADLLSPWYWGGRTFTVTYTVDPRPSGRVELSPGKSMKNRIGLTIPPGQYQFLFSYGVNQEK